MSIYERVLRWSCLSCRKHSNTMGGELLNNAWRQVPLKVLTTCPAPICYVMLDNSGAVGMDNNNKYHIRYCSVEDTKSKTSFIW